MLGAYCGMKNEGKFVKKCNFELSQKQQNFPMSASRVLLLIFLSFGAVITACSKEDPINTSSYFQGKSIYFTSDRSGMFNIWKWTPDTFKHVVNDPNAHYWWPRIQPGGDRFLVFKGPVFMKMDQCALWRYKQDGTEGEELIASGQYGWRSIGFANYSADRSQIILAAEIQVPQVNGYRWQLFLTDSLGQNPRQLSTRPAMFFEPSFNPQSNLKVIYTAWPVEESEPFTYNPRWSLEIFTAEIDTPSYTLKNETRLTNDNYWNSGPTPSSNGQRITYTLAEDQLHADKKVNLFTIWVNGTQNTELLRDGKAHYYPTWTPDNSYLVFQRTEWGFTSLYMTTSSGERLTPVIMDETFNYLHPQVINH